MDNYPGNSKRVAEGKTEVKKEKKVVTRVTTGEATFRKKPLGKRFTEIFIGGEDAKSVWSHVAADVLIPAAKDMVVDTFVQGIERTFYGESRGGGRSSRGARPATNGYTSYNRYSSPAAPRREETRAPLSRRARATHNFDEIILPTRTEAEEVIDGLFNLISEYESATVSDLYGMIGQTGDFTDEKWGWTDVRGAGVTRIRGGWLLNVPNPIQLD